MEGRQCCRKTGDWRSVCVDLGRNCVMVLTYSSVHVRSIHVTSNDKALRMCCEVVAVEAGIKILLLLIATMHEEGTISLG